MSKYAKLPKLILSEWVHLEVMCGDCGAISKMSWDDLRTKHSGGCGGHGPEEYCYCSGNELSVSYVCSGCKKTVYIVHESGFTY